MTMKPTKFEYEAPTRIAGKAPDAAVKLDVSQQSTNIWVATLSVVSAPCGTAGEAQTKLREELIRLTAMLGGNPVTK